MKTFEAFEHGKLVLPGKTIHTETIEWSRHAVFQGVELKHLLTAEDTEGQFSYHLVRIAPNMKIGLHAHETQLETHEVVEGVGSCVSGGRSTLYEPGVICVLPAKVRHEVTAGESGLFLLAKFIPALC